MVRLNMTMSQDFDYTKLYHDALQMKAAKAPIGAAEQAELPEALARLCSYLVMDAGNGSLQADALDVAMQTDMPAAAIRAHLTQAQALLPDGARLAAIDGRLSLAEGDNPRSETIYESLVAQFPHEGALVHD